jgi:hypothetical protein
MQASCGTPLFVHSRTIFHARLGSIPQRLERQMDCQTRIYKDRFAFAIGGVSFCAFYCCNMEEERGGGLFFYSTLALLAFINRYTYCKFVPATQTRFNHFSKNMRGEGGEWAAFLLVPIFCGASSSNQGMDQQSPGYNIIGATTSSCQESNTASALCTVSLEGEEEDGQTTLI